MSSEKGLFKFGPYIIIVALLCIIGYQDCNKPKPPQYFQELGFKVDTNRKNFYKLIQAKGDSMPPKEVIVYRDRPIPVERVDSIEIHDTEVVLIYKDKRLPIHRNYLEFQPGNPKIILGKFTGSGISLDLLDTSGHIYTTTYETRYSDFDYFFDGNKFTYAKRSRVTIPNIDRPPIITTQANIYGMYEALTNSPTLAVDGSIGFKKVSLYGNTQLGYQPKTESFGGRLFIGVRYSIK